MGTSATATAPRSMPAVREARAMPLKPRRGSRSERTLLRQLARQDPAAAETIQAEYGRVLLGYVRQLMDDHSAAEDVLQQVLLEAWQRGARFDPKRASVLTWLMTIARSRAIDAMRRRVPEPRDPSVTMALLDRSAAGADPADAVAAQWQVTYLLSTLPASHADLLRMRFQLGMSQSEIAEHTGIALGTVKTRMVKALEQLRELLEEGK